MPEVITIGETMALFVPTVPGPLRYATHFVKTTGGADSNVAIGLVRLGHTAGWISRLGKDDFGRYIYNCLRGEGVDVSQVTWDEEAPTGVFFKELRPGWETRIYYYRKGSAASRLAPEQLNRSYVRGARIVHITGVTLALSKSCRAAIHTLIQWAHEEGALVSLDPNLRLKLWPAQAYQQAILELLPQVDVFLPGVSEGQLLLGMDDSQDIARAAIRQGVRTVAVKLGKDGCLVATADAQHVVPGFSVPVIDPTGAGDAFAAGFLAGILEGLPLEECGRFGNAAGALAVTVPGDVEGLPDREELQAMLERREGVCR